MKPALLLTLVFAISLSELAMAKGPTYDWQKERKQFALSEKEKTLNEYILKRHKEYNYSWVNGELIVLSTEHQIIRVANSEAIQRHNKIYISMLGVNELVSLKARSISKDGKVVLFDQANLKEVKDDKTSNTYKAFAIEGIEIGSEIEYIYTVQYTHKIFNTIYMQFETPMRESSFTLTCPSKLAFDFRLYHDSTRMKYDSASGQSRYRFTLTDVRGLPREKYSAFDANRVRIEYKLAHNYASGNDRLNKWSDAAKSQYRKLVKLDEPSKKAVDGFIGTLDDHVDRSTVIRIKNIEDRVKNSIAIIKESDGGSYAAVPDVLTHKQASPTGVTRLFCLIFDKLKIPYQIVVTCDRNDRKFDGDFDTWTFLDEYLIYFPVTKGFLTPNENQLRYPLIDTHLVANRGLFIEPIMIGSFKSALGSIREIPALPYTADTDDLVIDVKFDDALGSNTVTQKRIFTGYQAAYFGAFYKVMTADQQAKFVEEVTSNSIPDAKIIKWAINQSTFEGLPRFEIVTTFSTTSFIENAGSRVLFKIGELIGPQSELYRDDNRQTEVDNTHNRGYDRSITIELPSKYKLSNAENIKMDVTYSAEADTPFLFKSNYKVEGNKLTVKISEYYKAIFAPVSKYEDFRKVINAAADFNKVTLVLAGQ